MKRLLMVCALAGLAIACGDDDDDKTTTPPKDGGMDAGGDAGGGSDAGKDAGPPVANKVTNVGAACTVATQATACTGAMPICQVSGLGMTPIPSGSCSAVCSSNAECGTGGICPTGVAIKMFESAKPILGDVGYCNKACTKGASTGCATGFSCLSLNDLSTLQGRMAVPGLMPLDDTFCFPTPTAPTDGGMGDGGTALRLDGGLDGGP